MDISSFHPYVYYATKYHFSKGQTSFPRICYASSIYLISEGKGIINTCGRTHKSIPGSLVYIPAGQPHEWIADEQDPMVHICCYFDWCYTKRKQVFETANTICYDFSQLHTSLIGPNFPFPIPEHSKVETLRFWIELFESFYTSNEYTNERTFIRSMKIQSHFQLFIEYFLNYVLNEENIPDPRIYKLLGQIEQDLMQDSLEPLENYCKKLQVSRGYFFELFKKATGLSPMQYINHFRISRAKDDLRFTKLTITEIAEKNHFSSIHYFSRMFRKLTGQTPREFRESERSV
ncbi:helix-turn-helix domain-containing protein [Neobacillus niacini]|uniref:helix-turn-helix domain-containing protein n=1 Tax=Neobacillus niacini TaxID=86668 RepID=UPI0005F0B4E4|nr:helix-turn-helix domain-containing protein [Neobacillus niacini]